MASKVMITGHPLASVTSSAARHYAAQPTISANVERTLVCFSGSQDP
jgi:hypothetical protein